MQFAIAKIYSTPKPDPLFQPFPVTLTRRSEP
jgi:hypothetical protein